MKEHSLLTLWNEIEQLLAQCHVPPAWGFPIDAASIRSRIDELERLDGGSFTFRYPEGTPHVQPDDVVGVGNLADVLDAVLEWLDATSTGIYERDQADAE